MKTAVVIVAALALGFTFKGEATPKQWENLQNSLNDLKMSVAAAHAATVPQPVRIGREMDRQCRFQWVDRGIWTPREEYLEAKCVSARFDPPGGLAKVLAVGSCESGWNRYATNGSFAGLFQQHRGYWTGRVAANKPHYWRLSPSIWNSRTQVVIAIRMAKADGTWAMSGGGDWACG